LLLSQLKLLYHIAKISPRIALKKVFSALTRKSKLAKLRAKETQDSGYIRFDSSGSSLPKYFDYKSTDDTSIIDLADRFSRHEFNLLGSGWVCLNHGFRADGIEGVRYPAKKEYKDLEAYISEKVNENNREEALRIASLIKGDYKPINWQLDFRSGYQWDVATWHKDIRFADDRGHDIKNPWELGRMQHLPILAYASNINKEYLIEIENQIVDFIASNPPKYGVQWNSSMDVAIRAINWLVTKDILENAGIHLDNSVLTEMTRSLYQHMTHIRDNLEWSDGIRGNHYLANLCGLLFISIYLEEYGTKEYYDFAFDEFIREIDYQFNSDGTNFEASTNYHFLSMEMVLLTAELLEKYLNKSLDEIFDSSVSSKISKMREYAADIIRENGSIAQIGDNDSGFILKLHSDEYLDPNGKDKVLERFLININYGEESCVSYPETGLYIVRRKRYRMDISCGGIGLKGKGGHAHNDLMSFTLMVGGKEIIVDPGSYVYTSFHKLRNLYRSTGMHNTLVISNLEQRNFIGNELSWLENNTNLKVKKFDESGFSAWHDGYGEKHTRKILFEDSNIIVSDECRLEKEKEIKFHLAPEVEIEEKEKAFVLNFWEKRIKLSYEQGRSKIGEYGYSPKYGVKIKSKVISIIGTEAKFDWRIEIL
jgi:hypothetical protein